MRHHITYYILPILYLAIGGTVTAMLIHRVLFYAASVWLVLLIPMVMLTVLLTVAGVVNVWLSYRTSNDEGLLRQYSQRSLLWLYLRCWGVVMSGLVLGVVFAWMNQLLPVYMQELFSHLSLLFYVICALLTLAALMSIVLGENLHEIRLRNAQTENQLLKSQLNPHFLYNTLNNIDALIWLDQERASSAVTSLSDLMRYMTYSTRRESVTLAEELRAIRQLCTLQSLRMSCPDAIQLMLPSDASPTATSVSSTDAATSPSLASCSIAPLLLIPLVENCFKHSGHISQPGSIIIRLELAPHSLTFHTDNVLPAASDQTSSTTVCTDSTASSHSSASPDTDRSLPTGRVMGVSATSGLGLTVLRRRLELLYPGRHVFTAGPLDGRFRTTLTISCWPHR